MFLFPIFVFSTLAGLESSVVFKFDDKYKDIEDVKNAKNEVLMYANLNESESVINMPPQIPKAKWFNAPLIDQEDPLFAVNSSKCAVPEWNNVRTDSIPNDDLHKMWAAESIGMKNYLFNGAASVLAAFAFKDHIVVTLTNENWYNKTVYCRYFDCHRKEIPDQFQSNVFPESTVFCARRPGAQFISVSETVQSDPEYSVPIVPRIEKPHHYFTVCMATLYGDEPKFLQIVDFIEYYKLQGATFFHIYLRNVSDYDRVLLDDYVRTGDIEIIKMHDHYWRDDFMWHETQINDCHHRNKYFSKWTAVIDVDERIEMRSEQMQTVVDFLDTIHDPNVVNLHMKIQWVIKSNDTPARYENDEQLMEEMLHHKYRNTSRIGSFWTQPKCIIRPERIGIMSIHAPVAIYSGIRRTLVNESIAVVRHYRNVEQRVFSGALQRMMDHGPFSIQSIPEWLDKKLSKLILDRVKWVYDILDVTCDQKQSTYFRHRGINASCWLDEQKERKYTDDEIKGQRWMELFYRQIYRQGLNYESRRNL